MSVVCTYYLNNLFMNKVGECNLSSIVHRNYFIIIFNEKSVHYTR